MTSVANGPSRNKTESGNEPINCNWKLARKGMSLLINNKEEEALSLFTSHLDCFEMFAGYATTLFMKAISTFEDDKVHDAMVALRDLENRCNRHKTNGWFRSLTTKDPDELSDAQHFEMNICMGDAQMYLAILTFIGHDLKSYIRGSWAMRKAWKTYQRTYDELEALYQTVSPLKESKMLMSYNQFLTKTGSCQNIQIKKKYPQSKLGVLSSKVLIMSKSNKSIKIKDNAENIEVEEELTQINLDVTSQTTSVDTKIFTRNDDKSISTKNLPFETKPLQNNLEVNEDNLEPEVFEAEMEYVSTEVDCNKLKDCPVQASGSSEREIAVEQTSTKSNYNKFTSLFFAKDSKKKQIDDESVVRLLKAVSFGYGLLQLGMSLMPPAILKLTSMFGFHGNREFGLGNLESAKNGTDMRAPLATFALLWYHTVARPFYSLDGLNIQAGLSNANELLDECADEYESSAFFLYFRGRTARLQSNILEAIVNLTDCINKSQQREMKLIAIHEIGWCYMIQLNYEQTKQTFIEMQQRSRWARAFYTYLGYLCTCIMNPSDSIKEYETVEVFFKIHQRRTPLDEYLKRRYKIILTQRSEHPKSYWKLLFFEVLYLWNAFACISTENIMEIIAVCEEAGDKPEPILGLPYLLMGSCYCVLKDTDNATTNFRTALALRLNLSNSAEDCHVSAFTLYELGQILLKEPDTKKEGTELLQQTQNYKNYDFDQRLSFRINSILKHNV